MPAVGVSRLSGRVIDIADLLRRAEVDAAAGELAEAERELREALAITRTLVAEERAARAALLRALITVLERQGRTAAAAYRAEQLHALEIE
jgi:hypothetical protein